MLAPITLNELPREGRRYAGELSVDIYQLPRGEYEPEFVPPLKYDLEVRLEGADVVVHGVVDALFQLRCSRCNGPVPWRARLDPYHYQEPRDGAATLDLTDLMREDTLLALPGYPRCEESNVDPHPCPRAGAVAPESEYVPLSEEETAELRQSDIWEALNQFQPDSPARTDRKPNP